MCGKGGGDIDLLQDFNSWYLRVQFIIKLNVYTCYIVYFAIKEIYVENHCNINILTDCLVYNFYYYICNTNVDIKFCAHVVHPEIPSSGMLQVKIYES
jgi:hypothetical protein